MNPDLKNRAFLRSSTVRVAVVDAVATGATLGPIACGDKDNPDTTPVQATTVTSTEELDDGRDDVDDDDRVNN